jgi:hypothetical protein
MAATTSTITRVTAAASSTPLAAVKASRKGMILYNESAASLYLKYGTAASLTSYTEIVPPNSPWYMSRDALYSGVIHGIWSSATGFAQVTELS